MSSATGMRRAVAAVRWDKDPDMISWVGNRPVHQYWPMISSYFRDLLLPPQRRADENMVTWTWVEPSQPEPLVLAEFRALRRRLESEQQLFVDNLSRVGAGTRGGGSEGQDDGEQLGAAMAQVVSRLVACSDAELATFLCRTEHGLRIHSWGAATAASPRFPDTTGLEIAGRVMVGGKPGLHDVILESGDGEHLAETPSDATGAFHFPKLIPGKYRLRARSTRGTFPPNGLALVLNRNSITDIILADREAPAAAVLRSRRSRRAASRATVIAVVGGLIVLLTGGTWLWFDHASEPMTPPVEMPVANAGKEPTSVAVTDPTPALATVTSVAGGSSARADPAARREHDPFTRMTPVKPLTPPARAVSNSEQKDVFLEAAQLGEDHVSRPAGSHPDPAGLTLNPGAASMGVPGISPSTGISSLAAAASPTSSPSAFAVNAGLVASPVPGGGSSVGALAGGLGRGGPAANTTEAPLPTADSPSLSATAVATAPAASPSTQPSSTHEPKAALPQAEMEPKSNTVLATIESSPPVPAVKADSLVAKSVEADAKDSLSAALLKATADEATASANRTSPDSDTTNGDEAPRTLAERADRERIASNDVSGTALTPDSRLAQHSMSNLTRTVRVRLAPWRLQLLEDTILPTQPVRADQVESVAALRRRLLAEQQARLPEVLRKSEVLNGVVLALPRDLATAALVWRDHKGAVAGNSQVKNGRAEIVWNAENAPVEHPVRLMRADGEIVAEVRQEAAARELVVRMAEDVRAWLRWIIRAPAQEAGLSDGSATRFVWRASTGGPMPPGWVAGLEGAQADHRLDLPIGGTMGSVALQRYALFDHHSGWALVAELRQAADRPLSE